MEQSRNPAGPPKSRYAIIPFRVKFILGCYLLLLLLIIVQFIMLLAGMFSVLEAAVFIPITFFALFSCVYDLMDYQEELFRLQEYLIKRLKRLHKKAKNWRDERFD